MTFQGRLKRCLKAGNLTVADLARWFNRPDPTVRGWVLDGRQPAGPAKDRDDLLRSLAWLERRIAVSNGFPVPRMSQRERKAYLERMRP